MTQTRACNTSLSDGNGGFAGDTDGSPEPMVYRPTLLNRPPVANSDSYSTNEDIALSVAAPAVLGNDSDPDVDPNTAVVMSSPTKGALTLNSNGAFSYTPNADFNGTDSFSYMTSDGTAMSNTATVTITVNPVNDAPVANNDAYSTNEDTTLTVAAPGVLATDGDVDGDALTAVLVAGPVSGTLSLSSDGSFTYAPNANFNGSDSFHSVTGPRTQPCHVEHGHGEHHCGGGERPTRGE